MSNLRHMTLKTLCDEAGLFCPSHMQDTVICGVTSDSRRVKKGWLFVAIPGLHVDGAAYIPQALQRGAAAVIAPPYTEYPSDVPLIKHESPRRALALLCDAWYGHPARRLRLVGVTGTNGKTSVSTMLAHILRSAGIPVGVIGTLGVTAPSGQRLQFISPDANANMTTPDPEELYALLSAMAEEVREGEEAPVVVMEVSSHALLLEKIAPLCFACGVFTNLTPEHLDMHGTMEAYYAAKRRLFSFCRVAVVNADDPFGENLISDPETSAETWYVCHTSPIYQCVNTLHPGRCCNRVYAGQVKLLGGGGVEYRLLSPSARVRLTCPVPGMFSVMNSMEAAVAAMALGLSPGKIKDALATFNGVPGRMERIPLASHVPFTVFLDYAHTPDALANLLTTAQRFKKSGERVVLLFGCGGERDRQKRPLMAAVASRLADSVIVTSDNSRGEDPSDILEDILGGMDPACDYTVIPDRHEAIVHAIRTAHPGDVILLSGKGHETYEIDRNGRHPFDEKELVLAAVRQYHSEM